jgi:hypothetical protein
MILGNKDNFHIDGYHKTLFQVELPDWLPLEIVVKLTTRFEEILLQQIGTLAEKKHRRHHLNPSGQSRDSLSSTLPRVKLMPMSILYPIMQTFVIGTNFQVNHPSALTRPPAAWPLRGLTCSLRVFVNWQTGDTTISFVLLCRYKLSALAFRVQALLLKSDRFATFMEVQIAHASIPFSK